MMFKKENHLCLIFPPKTSGLQILLLPLLNLPHTSWHWFLGFFSYSIGRGEAALFFFFLFQKGMCLSAIGIAQENYCAKICGGHKMYIHLIQVWPYAEVMLVLHPRQSPSVISPDSGCSLPSWFDVASQFGVQAYTVPFCPLGSCVLLHSTCRAAKG